MTNKLAFLMILLAANLPAVAAESSEPEPANYAFSAYMGSGFYGATNASLFMLNVPMTFDWPQRDDIRIRLSTSAGFFDYGRDNIEDLELPDSLGTLTVIPGLEKVYKMSEHWELIPHIDWGIARDFASGEGAQVYSTGVHSRFYRNGDLERHVWVNKLILAQYRTFSTHIRDTYVKLLTGYDYKTNAYVTLKEGIALATVYGSISWSHNGMDYLDELQAGSPSDLTYELGVSLYAPKPVDLWITSVDRVGLGVQNSPFGTVVRLFFGTPF